jgi:hypothetical protein
MSDREFENYLALLSGMLRLRRTQRESISGELRDHLIEHVAHLEASGSTHEEAVRRALEEFGDAAALAANFSALVGMRRRRLIMRCTIGTTVVMTGLVVAMLAFRPEVRDDPNVVQAQAESEPRAEKQIDAVKKKAGPPLRDADQRTRLALKQPTRVEFTETPLGIALETLCEQHGVQHYIDKRSLVDLHLTQDEPITFNLKDVPFDMVLDLILRELRLGYRVRNGVIVIASEEVVQSQTEVRVYRVPDGMAEELAALIPATIDDQSWREHVVLVDPRGQRRAGYGAVGGGYGAAPGYGQVAGESAETVGGGPQAVGTVRVFRGTVVVSQTPEVHQKIEKLLADLDRAGAMEPQRRPDGPGEGDRSGYGRVPQTSPFGEPVQPGYGQTGRGGGGYGSVPRTSSDRSGYGRASPAPTPAADVAPGQPPTSDDSIPVPGASAADPAATPPGAGGSR